MKKVCAILLFFLLSIPAKTQYEEKISLLFSAGTFKTLGNKYGGIPPDLEPRQMPWYKAGIAAEGGAQFKVSSRLSILTEIGILYSPEWECISEDEHNWMHYEIWDKEGINMLSSGYNKMQLLNLSCGIKPLFYLMPGKKFNPFLYAGVSVNYTKAPYINNYWEFYRSSVLYEPGDTEDWPYMEKNTGLGLNPGIGIEYAPNDRLAFSLSSGYCLILINEKNFPYYSRDLLDGNLNAILIKAGLRLNFIKKKDL
jgi:opacity protein-like surface antigen